MYILQPNTPRAFSHSKNCLSEPGIDFTDYNSRDDRRPTAPVSQAAANQNGKTDQPISVGGTTPAMAAAPVDVTPAAAPTRDLNQMDLKREDVRLVTFDNANWDVPFLNAGKLAQIGFYYMGVQDVVKCFFCKVEIGKWEPQDDCFAEHIRWSPSCPLLRRHPTENVPIDAEELYQILPPVTYDTCGPASGGIVIRPHAFAERSFTPSESGNELQSNTGSSRSVGSTASTSSLSGAESPLWSHALPTFGSSPVTDNNSQSVTLNERYPGILGPTPSYYNTYSHLEIEANRLKTFKEWPIQLKMKPAELSDAGFFYTGGGDRVQCFSCGGGLKNWEDNDVAWEQHALWYSNCEYLKLIKGPKYIAAVQEMHRQANDERHHGEESASSDLDENEEETVESAEEAEPSGSSQLTRIAPLEIEPEGGEGDVIPGTSRVRQILTESAESVKIAPRRRRRVAKNCDSHPESEINSPEAILAAKSAKPSEVPETKLCKICFECEFNTAFLPCGHVVACAKCASAVSTCPVCREPFDTVTRIYFS